jgi:very-short-patch-repair endonuclease
MTRASDGYRTQRPQLRGLVSIAQSQYGVFSREQAMRCRVSDDVIRRRVEAGIWERVDSGIYRVVGSVSSWRQALMIVCFYFQATSIVSHGSAGAFWAMPGFVKKLPIEYIAERTRSRDVRRPGAHWIGPIPESDVQVVEMIRVTTPARTLLDVSQETPNQRLEEALDDALRRRLVRIKRLRDQLEAAGRRPGVAKLRALLDARDPAARAPESVLETKVARILRKARIPSLVAQHDIVAEGRLVARVDFAIPTARIAIEADGYGWHSGRAHWQRDLRRRNALTNLGWRVIHVTWDDLKRPQAIVDQVEQALRARLF